MSWLGRVFRRDSAQRELKQLRAAPELSAALAQVKQLASRMDGYRNLISGLGTMLDKSRGGWTEVDVVNDQEAKDLWLGSDMAARIIETYPVEAMRRGYRIKIATDDTESTDEADEAREKAEAIVARGEELRLNEHITRAMQYRRAYGGAALFPVIDGAQGSLAQPLAENRISKILALHLLEPRELQPYSWYNDLNDPKFGKPKHYVVMPIVAGGMSIPLQLIHESRLIIFQGKKITRLHQAGTRLGWGDSVLTPVKQVLLDFDAAWSSAAALMQDFAQAVLKLDGFDELMAQDQDAVARDRIAQIDMIRSLLRMVVIGTKDEFERKQTPLSQLPELLDRFAVRLAAAGDMPVTRLMGQSPAGLNATGESDRAFMYDRVAHEQNSVEPEVDHGLRLIMLEIEGPCEGKEPDNWCIDWLPVWQPSEKDQAQTRFFIAQADDLWINNQTVTPEEAASHWHGDTFSPEIQLDWKARAQMKALNEATPEQVAPTPLLGPDGQPVLGPDGKPIMQPPPQPKKPPSETMPKAQGTSPVSPPPVNGTPPNGAAKQRQVNGGG